MEDVVVIGAGLAGLICAKRMRQEGLRVRIVEKSAGVGGRLATRRLQGTWADHGAQYVSAHGEVFGRFMAHLQQQGIAQEWARTVTRLTPEGSCDNDSSWIYPRYTCPTGLTAIAKYLATDQKIDFNTKIADVRVEPGSDKSWQLTTDSGQKILASALVSTMPAPQFVVLFQDVLGVTSELLKAVQSVRFHPNITIIAGYSSSQAIPDAWKAFRCEDDFVLRWISHDSSKHLQQLTQPVFVLQSTSEFAYQSFEELNLEKVGLPILQKAGEYLEPWLQNPQWWQVHKWRYAFAQEALGVDCLTTTLPLPLVCAGDWCAGKNLESAYTSGLAAAVALMDLIEKN